MARHVRVGERDAQPFDDHRLLGTRAAACTPAGVLPGGRPPQVFASEDNGATPPEIVLAALGACLTAGVATVATNRGVELRSVKATVEGTMDLQGILGIDGDVRNGFDAINVTYEIDADASRADIEAIVAESQKRSAVFDVVANPTTVRVRSDAYDDVDGVRVPVVIVGAGPGGLAMSRELTRAGVEHLVLERGRSATPGGRSAGIPPPPHTQLDDRAARATRTTATTRTDS